MLRKLKLQIPGEPLAARYNWCRGPVPGRGPAVEKHRYTNYLDVSSQWTEISAVNFARKLGHTNFFLSPDSMWNTQCNVSINSWLHASFLCKKQVQHFQKRACSSLSRTDTSTRARTGVFNFITSAKPARWRANVWGVYEVSEVRIWFL